MTIIAPTLVEGIEYVESVLNIELTNAASHRDMGTHNRRVKLGPDCYLEIIAVDPDAPPPSRPRWFGLDNARAVRTQWEDGFRLRGWVARTNDIDQVLMNHSQILGSKTWLDDHFDFSVLPSGELPMNGALPSVIDVGDSLITATKLVDQGFRLTQFILEHPDPNAVADMYDKIGILNPPTVVHGPSMKFRASIDGLSGVKEIT